MSIRCQGTSSRIEERMKNGWEYDEMEEEDTIDSKKEHMGELANNDEKAK